MSVPTTDLPTTDFPTTDLPTTEATISRPVRLSWQLSPSGRYAACTVVSADAPSLLEVRDLDQVGRARLHPVPGLSMHSQLVPDDQGGVLLCHHREGEHVVQRLTPDHHLVEVARAAGTGGFLLHPPGPAGGQALALAADGDGTTIHRVDAANGVTPLRPVARVTGLAIGAVRLGPDQLAVNVVGPDGHCSAVLVDLATAAVEPLFSVRPTSDDRVVGHHPAGGGLVVSTTAGGEARLGTGHWPDGRIAFPPALAGPASVSYLATSPDGRRLAVAIDAGARSRLAVFDCASGELADLPAPALTVVAVAGRLGDDGTLVVPVSSPDRPGTVLRTGPAGFSFDDEPVAGVTGRLIAVPGAAGELEAVVLGDVEAAEEVVVALHGGPLDAWRASWDPLLAALAAAGIAVVAPNVRGSTRYGTAHALAIRGDWGGPDRADVEAVGRRLRERRPHASRRPILLGTSYGAYLAVRTAAQDPGAWSACIAVAPFLSGARVVADGGPVAELVRRLGGDPCLDLRHLAGALASGPVPTLLLHGLRDDVIPPGESELLAQALRRAGAPVRHRPVPGAGHDLLTGPHRRVVLESVLAFLHER